MRVTAVVVNLLADITELGAMAYLDSSVDSFNFDRVAHTNHGMPTVHVQFAISDDTGIARFSHPSSN
jgi:hypothetical protein